MSWVERLCEGMSDPKVAALRRVAKTRGYAFFKDPKAMIALREINDRRKASAKT